MSILLVDWPRCPFDLGFPLPPAVSRTPCGSVFPEDHTQRSLDVGEDADAPLIVELLELFFCKTIQFLPQLKRVFLLPLLEDAAVLIEEFSDNHNVVGKDVLGDPHRRGGIWASGI